VTCLATYVNKSHFHPHLFKFNIHLIIQTLNIIPCQLFTISLNKQQINSQFHLQFNYLIHWPQTPVRLKRQTQPCSCSKGRPFCHVTENGSCHVMIKRAPCTTALQTPFHIKKLLSDVFPNKSSDLNIHYLSVTDSSFKFTPQRPWLVQQMETTMQIVSLSEMSTLKETFLFCLTLLCVH
jgi:hypothetical protein